MKRIDKYKNKSFLEIGCGNGYILKILNEIGFQDLVGIEPAIQKTENIDGISFLKEFVTKDLDLGKRFDFIFSFGVYEHVEDIDMLSSFCRSHLKANGELFIYTPNCHRSLVSGDPGVFVHEHIKYFTKNSIKYHLSRHGFFEIENMSDDHALVIYARKNKKNQKEKIICTPYNNYQKKLDENLEKIKSILCNSNVMVHGVCSSLNNILGWISRNFNFVLIDNDNTKHGRIFFNKKVHSISGVNLRAFNTVLIVPTFFSAAIKAAYKQRGFRGQFRMVT